MNALTCQEVEELLDLLAADACDPPTRVAVESHLRQCEACSASYAESQRLQGLLDLHLNQESVERLHRRIEEEAQPRRKMRFLTPFVRRASLVAALVLIAVGVIWWLPKPETARKVPQLALLVRTGKLELDVPQPLPARLESKDAVAVVLLPPAERSGNTVQRELLQAQRDGKLPLPPAVHLELALINNGKHPVEVRLGDAEAKLSFELSGAGVIRFAAPAAETPESLRSQTLQVDPGKQLVFAIDRLIAGAPGKLEYIYLAEPGEITLTPHLRLTADGQVMTVTGATVRIRVGNRPADAP